MDLRHFGQFELLGQKLDISVIAAQRGYMNLDEALPLKRKFNSPRPGHPLGLWSFREVLSLRATGKNDTPSLAIRGFSGAPPSYLLLSPKCREPRSTWF